MSSSLISTGELASRLADPELVILDASWHLPAARRDPWQEFRNIHIPNARFFDIDGISDLNSPLPHMLPGVEQFSAAAGELGISNHSEIVVYDSTGLTSTARCWWTFRVFGHQQVRVLKGGLPKWIAEKRPLGTGMPAPGRASYGARFLSEHVAEMPEVLENCRSAGALVLDARSTARFYAEAPETRPGLQGGHIPGSKSLPFTELFEDGALIDTARLKSLFAGYGVDGKTAVITSCGSGVTAAIINLALVEAGYGLNRLYDGSWAEWGARQDTPKFSSRSS